MRTLEYSTSDDFKKLSVLAYILSFFFNNTCNDGNGLIKSVSKYLREKGDLIDFTPLRSLNFLIFPFALYDNTPYYHGYCAITNKASASATK